MAFGLSAGAAALIGSVAAPVIGGLIGGSSSGNSQGGTQTVNKDPWSAAQPWMRQNLTTGQNLQNYYQTNPFNAQQQSAYSNLGSGADYINRAVPGLLQQFSQPTGFDRSNPTARPSPINFSAPSVAPQAAQAFGGQMQASAPVQGSMNQTVNPFGNGSISPMAQAEQVQQTSQADIQKMIDAAMAQNQKAALGGDRGEWSS